jgi:sarcosine oxidase subunit alpha
MFFLIYGFCFPGGLILLVTRIKQHPILDFPEKKPIPFFFNGKKLYGLEGDTIASALHANGIKVLSRSLKYNRARGFFCGIGKCASCLMRVNNVPNVRICITPLTEDISVETQEKGFGKISEEDFENYPLNKIDTNILIVGAGPAGLCAAIEAAKLGANVLVVDENSRVGGQLIKQTHKFFGSTDEMAGVRGVEIAKILEDEIKKLEKKGKINILLNSTVIGYYESQTKNKHRFAAVKRLGYKNELYDITCDKVIFTCGARENMIVFPGNDLPGVYGAGAVQTLMNVYGVKPGNKVLMVGAGNVGLIVSYQLLQAGVEVDRVIEALPFIGGYHVHAAKLRRCGVPIYTSHTILKAHGKDKVEGATVIELDKNWQPIAGTEEYIECDTICLAVGLTPSVRLIAQTGATIDYIPEASGYIALHNESMETSKKGVFVAGDLSGIEEASTAMLEGKIAGISAAVSLGYGDKKIIARRKKEFLEKLASLRAGPFGEKPRKAKQRILNKMKELQKRDKNEGL